MGKGNPRVRIWSEVHHTYKTIAQKHKLSLADLASLVLLYTPIFSPYLIALALLDNYDMSRDEAIDIALELRDTIEQFCRIYLEAKETEVEEYA